MWNRASDSRRAFCVSVMLIGLAGGWLESWGSPPQKTTKSDRPQVQWGISKLGPLEVGSYDSKAEPAAEVLQALNMMNLTGWDVIRQYYPELGVTKEKGGASVNPRDPTDSRFYVAFVNEEPGRSSVPLISMISSLEASEVSGRLKSLRAE